MLIWRLPNLELHSQSSLSGTDTPKPGLTHRFDVTEDTDISPKLDSTLSLVIPSLRRPPKFEGHLQIQASPQISSYRVLMVTAGSGSPGAHQVQGSCLTWAGKCQVCPGGSWAFSSATQRLIFLPFSGLGALLREVLSHLFSPLCLFHLGSSSHLGPSPPSFGREEVTFSEHLLSA